VFVNRRCKICKVIHTLSWLWDSHVHRYRCDVTGIVSKPCPAMSLRNIPPSCRPAPKLCLR
jgi:hypothetical protein